MRSLGKKISKFYNLSFTDKILLVKTLALLLFLRLSLKLLSFSQFKRLYSRLTESNKVQNITDTEIAQKVRIIGIASNFLHANCLPQALALKYFLRNDKSAEIIIGVNNSKDFAAHAWVEKNGEILIGEIQNADFTPLWNWK